MTDSDWTTLGELPVGALFEFGEGIAAASRSSRRA